MLLYLKAREEEGYSYYQDSVTLAKKAFRLAVDAQRLAQQRKAEEIAEAAKKAAEEKKRSPNNEGVFHDTQNCSDSMGLNYLCLGFAFGCVLAVYYWISRKH